MMNKKLPATVIVCLVVMLSAVPWMIAYAGESPSSPAPKLPRYLVTLGEDSGIQYVRTAATNDIVERYTGIKMLFQLGRDFPIGIPLLQSGEAHLYRGGMFDFYEMFRGIGRAKRFGKTDVRIVMPGYLVALTYWVSPATQKKYNIKALGDCGGLTINRTIRGRLLHLDMLQDARFEYYHNLQDRVVWLPPMGKPEQEEAFAERRVQLMARAPTAGMLAAKQALGGIYPIPATQGEIDYVISTKQQIWNSSRVFRAGYGGILDTDLLAIGPLMGLGCIASLSDDTVYTIVKAVYDHLDELIQVDDSFRENLPEEGLPKYFPAPYHPGSIKYLKEKGMWGAELDKRQQELLAMR